MSRTPARFTQEQMDDACQLAKETGQNVVFSADGTIRLEYPTPPVPPPPPHPGYVYFIQCGPFIKIGWTMNLQGRLENLQTSNPYKLTMLAAFVGSLSVEREMHDRFKAQRGLGEWFSDCPEIRAYIGELHSSGQVQQVLT